jgi:hypothetical protein
VDYEKQLKLEMDALKNTLLTAAEIDPAKWNAYVEYMSAQGKNAEVWKMYEAHVTKHSSKNNIMYSQELDNMIGYLDDVQKEKWMSEQIRVSPNDKNYYLVIMIILIQNNIKLK